MAPCSDNKKNNLVGLLVHAYNNHLAAMMGYAELASLDNQDPIFKEKLDLILASGTEAVELGKNMLAVVGRLQVVWTKVSLVSLIAKLEEKWRVKRKSSVDLSLGEKINTNGNWFVDCLGDLSEFVCDYSGVGSATVNIEGVQEPQAIQIIIESNGIKLTEGQIKQLFDPFYSSQQLSNTKGLGLAKAKGFFGQMQAKLEWKNGFGFILHLPLSSDRFDPKSKSEELARE